MMQIKPGVNVHETAHVDPSAVLQGNVTVGAWSRIAAGVVITGNVTIGEHTTIYCNTAIRGTVQIGDYVQIYDCVCIEGGRAAGRGTCKDGDKAIIKDHAWVNHGATMHGSQIGEYAAIGLNACLDYNCRIGDGALVMNGSACRVDTVVPANCAVEGVPAKVIRESITDEDRLELIGLTISAETLLMAQGTDSFLKRAKGV